MKLLLKSALALSILYAACLSAAEPGFIPLFDRDHTQGWKQCGKGQMRIKDGIATTFVAPDLREQGCWWYAARVFQDFVLSLEFMPESLESDSGVFLRFPDPAQSMEVVHEGDEVQIIGNKAAADPTGAIVRVKTPTAVPQRAVGQWNELRVMCRAAKCTIELNGKLVNEFNGTRNLSGYIGIQQVRTGPVQFRNIRIQELTTEQQPAAIQIDANQPRIDVLKEQGPNALEWALSPLDQPLPNDIRQSLTYLREDLLDESKNNPKSSATAYQRGSVFCDQILTTLDQRDIARVNAGYAAAQADASKKISNSQLDVSRNYKMSWPQYRREESQRAALRELQSNAADLKKERSKVEWTARSVKMRDYLDDLYRQFREALRK